MNKKHFKIISTTFTCMLALLLTLVLSASAYLDEKPTVQKQSHKSVYVCPPDSAVVSRIGDTVCTILFSAKKATLYKINVSSKARDNDKTIGGVVVENCLGKMSTNDLYALQMIMSDKNSYSDSPIVPLTPYAPSYAVELMGPNGTIYLMFSLLSQEVGVVYDGLLIATHQYKGRGLMAKPFRKYISEEYMNYLINL